MECLGTQVRTGLAITEISDIAHSVAAFRAAAGVALVFTHEAIIRCLRRSNVWIRTSVVSNVSGVLIWVENHGALCFTVLSRCGTAHLLAHWPVRCTCGNTALAKSNALIANDTVWQRWIRATTSVVSNAISRGGRRCLGGRRRVGGGRRHLGGARRS